nr:uroporphyrinogen-III synthase [Bacillus subtilis]
MGKGLLGKRVAIGGSRKTEEISTIIEKQGGIPVIRLSPRYSLLSREAGGAGFADVCGGKKTDWVIFTTGIGLETLVDMAEKIGLKDEFLQVYIRQAKAACRGYKTLSALKKLGITPEASDEDGTTRGLIRSLEPHDFSGKTVMVQLHGEKAPALMAFLEEKGASVLPILPYQHIPPEEETVERLCRELMNDEVDAVCFTTVPFRFVPCLILPRGEVISMK